MSLKSRYLDIVRKINRKTCQILILQEGYAAVPLRPTNQAPVVVGLAAEKVEAGSFVTIIRRGKIGPPPETDPHKVVAQIVLGGMKGPPAGFVGHWDEEECQ
jgi:hypothetical protein